MKTVLAITVLLLVSALAVYGQAPKQPNGPPQGITQGVVTQQGTQSLMYGGVHDFGITSAIGNQNQSDATCYYCHRAHISKDDGQPAPLWARASLATTNTYGVYSSVSLDGIVAPIDDGTDNYSSFCLSCHDGSQMLATAAWGDNSHPYNNKSAAQIGGTWTGGNYWPPAWDDGSGSPTTVPAATFDDANATTTGDLLLTHTHPVNFDYRDAQGRDGQLYAVPAGQNYVWLNTGTAPSTAVGRLFGGKMQCSSCHNPHFKTGIGAQGSSSKGALCVACHIK